MSERSQARRHPDDTRCQNEVRPDDTLTTHDVRTKSEGSQTMSGHHYGQAVLSTPISEIALPPIPFSQHTPTCSQMHAKGYPSFLSSPSFFHSNPAECLEQGAWPQKYLSPLINSLVSSRFHIYIYHYTMTMSLFQRNISLYSIIYQPDILKPMLPPPK